MLTQKRGELDHLLKVEIPTNYKAIQTAREFGDLSENFEYKSAKQRAVLHLGRRQYRTLPRPAR